MHPYLASLLKRKGSIIASLLRGPLGFWAHLVHDKLVPDYGDPELFPDPEWEGAVLDKVFL